MTTQLIRKLKGTNRESIRKEITEWFLEEVPGTGRLELRSVYHYQVENLSNGRQIVLRRPARLNKGFDFEVAIPGSNFGINRKTELPSHASIVNDLMEKRKKNSILFDKVQTLIKRIYACEVITDEELASLCFEDAGHPIDHILKAIQWLFIEQDITYWNWSGRAMFYAELENI
jgi:hypothetical protein